MDLEKECRQKQGDELSTVDGQKEESDWRYKQVAMQTLFPDNRNRHYTIPSNWKGFVLSKPFTFTKTDRIRTTTEYRTLSKCGARHYSDYFIIVYRKNQIPQTRLGVTVSKRVGKAVTRNRIKRIIREYFRSNRSILPVRLDINVIARQPSGNIGNAVLRDHLDYCFGAIAEKPKNALRWLNWH